MCIFKPGSSSDLFIITTSKLLGNIDQSAADSKVSVSQCQGCHLPPRTWCKDRISWIEIWPLK